MTESKASLIKSLKNKDIPVPKGATVAELRHRDTYWIDGNGYLFRLAVPTNRKAGHPVSLLENGVVFWVPNSEFAKMIANSNMVFLLGRALVPPSTAKILDLPKDFSDRWG